MLDRSVGSIIIIYGCSILFFQLALVGQLMHAHMVVVVTVWTGECNAMLLLN